jgi:hypothetical protein
VLGGAMSGRKRYAHAESSDRLIGFFLASG